jgi:hypothetical protein
MTFHRAQPKQHSYVERGDDLYATPPEAVHALLRVYQPPHRVWEPACGTGSIVEVLRDAGHDVVASDLRDWGCPGAVSDTDFLAQGHAPPDCRCILTNFPYRLAEACVTHALRLVPEVVALCRLAFLESERRTALLERSGLQRVIVFRNRLPMMHRHNWTGPRNSSSTAFAWFIWNRAYVGAPIVERISCSACTPTGGREGQRMARRGVRTGRPFPYATIE